MRYYYYNLNKFSQLFLASFSSCFLKILFSSFLGPLTFCFFGGNVGAFICIPGVTTSRIWLSMPTNSSSTLWFRAADVSMYLQLYWWAIESPSEK